MLCAISLAESAFTSADTHWGVEAPDELPTLEELPELEDDPELPDDPELDDPNEDDDMTTSTFLAGYLPVMPVLALSFSSICRTTRKPTSSCCVVGVIQSREADRAKSHLES